VLKKAAVAVLGLIFAMSLIGSQRAAAQVHVGVGVSVGTPVVVQPAPVIIRPAPVVVEAPPPTVVVYDEAFFVGHCWDYGFHDGWYYDHGTRYWIDRHHSRHYDNRYREARFGWERHRHDNGWHGERGPGHDNGWHNGERHEHGGGHGRGHDEDWHADRGHGHGHGHND
jgi:hypothetical protein